MSGSDGEKLHFDWRWARLVARLCMASLFLVAAAIEILGFSVAAATQQHFGLYGGWLWAVVSIVVQLVGSVVIISGYHVWLGAGILARFTGRPNSSRAASGN